VLISFLVAGLACADLALLLLAQMCDDSILVLFYHELGYYASLLSPHLHDL
jgi:uncharacterized membrane protein